MKILEEEIILEEELKAVGRRSRNYSNLAIAVIFTALDTKSFSNIVQFC